MLVAVDLQSGFGLGSRVPRLSAGMVWYRMVWYGICVWYAYEPDRLADPRVERRCSCDPMEFMEQLFPIGCVYGGPQLMVARRVTTSP